MKQKNIIMAYKAINNFNQNEKNKKNASVRITHDLFIIKKLLDPHWQYQVEREQELAAETEAEMQKNGFLKFPSAEKEKLFFDKLTEISELDVDLGDFAKVRINLSEDIVIPMEDMEALEPFAEFVG